jgi:dihydrofolate reductase
MRRLGHWSNALLVARKDVDRSRYLPLQLMAKLIYTAIASLDGYVADADGKYDWAAPDPEVHSFVNALERPIGTYLYGRRLYEVMASWETLELAGQPAALREYAEIWRAAEKIVYSRTLQQVTTARTRLERDLDPDELGELKGAAERDISVGGPNLAAQAIKSGLVDECHLFLVPVVVGAGNKALPEGVHLKLELMSERRFGSGVVHLHYSVQNSSGGAMP